ncbi:MAG: VCBS repeat-containing protein [Actinotalea sp.]|nr:VCBS repeat-containing protein [Actinotalea sp.]
MDTTLQPSARGRVVGWLLAAVLLVPVPAAAAEQTADPAGAPEAGPGTVAPAATPGTTTSTQLQSLATPTVVVRPPTTVLPVALDAVPGYQATVSCDPNDRPGVRAFADLVTRHYGYPRFSTSRACAGYDSQHHDGRAMDWPMNAFDPTQRAVGDAVAAWLTADDGAVARRFGIMLIIWNRQVWYTHRPAQWQAYTGPSPHTDHLHFSFTWDGAMGRTSWWTGVPVTQVDHGTCRVYQDQYAPRYTGRRTAPCPTNLPSAPWSPYPAVLPGATGELVTRAQSYLGLPSSDIDGRFGPRTLTAVLDRQRGDGLPVTGVVDNATWGRLLAALPTGPYQQVVLGPDVTGDRHGDVVVVDGTGRLAVHPGTGAAALAPARPVAEEWSERVLHAPGDWDRDGRGDLMSVDDSGRLWLHPGRSGTAFAAPRQIGRGWTGFRIVPAGDVDGDKVLDLLAIDPSGRLWLYPGAGDGGFRTRTQVGRGWSSFRLYAAGDMDRDGRPDVLGVDGQGRLFFYAGRPAGFARAVQVGRGWSTFLLASGADLTGDGIGDLVGRGPTGDARLFPGRVGGTFGSAVVVARDW